MSIFNKFHIIGISEYNCLKIRRALFVAMNKSHPPEILKLHFEGKMTQTMRKMKEDYKVNIISLDIEVNGNEDLLLQPSFVFRYLESLSLDFSCCDYNTMVPVFEAMLDKHASNLKSLKLKSLQKTLKLNGLEEKVRVPALPVLDSLELDLIGEDAARTILEQSRPTISSLVMSRTLHSIPFRNDDYNNSLVYQIPNIRYLRFEISNDFGFVMCNANHLISLNLRFIRGIPNYIEWPQFPNLRELSIDDNDFIPILKNSRETLECLVMFFILSPPDEHADMVMPRLTDLYLHYINDAFSSKICNSNNRSLEFLYLCGKDIPNLNEGIRMESMRNVVLWDKTPQDRERMLGICPNAEVVLFSDNNKNEIIEMRDMIRTRCKRRNFHCQFLTYHPVLLRFKA